MIKLLRPAAPLALRHRVIVPSMSCGIVAYHRQTSLRHRKANANIYRGRLETGARVRKA
jgi:hypothetical protein